MTAVLEALSAVLIVTGSVLCLFAAIGLVRFPDLLSRMHAATKPQSLGMVCVLLGVGLGMGRGVNGAMLVLVACFQLLTTPVASHLMSRAALRAGQVSHPVDHRREIESSLGRPHQTPAQPFEGASG